MRSIATIRGVEVTQDSANVARWTTGADIDADGTNGSNKGIFAYRSDNSGLDTLADAGYPNQEWSDVLLDVGGKPLSNGRGGLYSSTSYFTRDNPISTRYLDATQIPYVVVNPIVLERCAGVCLGCLCYVKYNGLLIVAVCGDISGENDIGELSIKAAQMLGIPDSPRDGGVNDGVSFSMCCGRPAIIDNITYVLQPAGSLAFRRREKMNQLRWLGFEQHIDRLHELE